MSGIIGVSPDMRSGVVGKFPAGHVIGMWNNSRGSSAVTINNTGGTSTNSDSLVGVDTANRVFAEELSVAVDVSSTTSDLFVIGTVGVGSMSWSNKGAYGMVLNIPSPTTNYAYDSDNYPFYPAKTSFGDVTSGYGVGLTRHVTVKGVNSLVKSGSYNIKIYVYAYNETSPSGTQSMQTQNSDITVFEIQR